MLYNIKKHKIQTPVDCLDCEYYDKKMKKCTCYGKICFEYDPKTKTIIDPVTHLPINTNKL